MSKVATPGRSKVVSLQPTLSPFANFSCVGEVSVKGCFIVRTLSVRWVCLNYVNIVIAYFYIYYKYLSPKKGIYEIANILWVTR